MLVPSAQQGAVMKQTGEYAGVVLDGIDPVKIAEGFGVDGMHVQDEARLAQAISPRARCRRGRRTSICSERAPATGSARRGTRCSAIPSC